jgi:hypothetical protein
LHLIKLKDSSVRFKIQYSKQKYYDLNTIEVEGPYSWESNLPIQLSDQVQFISKQTFEIVNQVLPTFGLEWLRNFYVYKLQKKGFATPSFRIKFKELLPSFINFYGSEFLDQLDSSLDKNAEDTWLHKVLRKPRVSCHPLRHLLLIRFLDENIISLRKQAGLKLEYHPFGTSPFPCLNKAASHYLENVINECEITRCDDSGKPIGTFKCDCGFIYSRRGPDVSDDDRYKIGRIKQFGYVWEESVEELYNKQRSIVQVAKELGADRGSVSKYLNSIQRNQTENRNQERVNVDKKSLYREKWLNHTRNNPNFSRTELRDALRSVYIWLYRNEKEWLFGNLPPKRNKGTGTLFNRVNWEQRDDMLASLIKIETEKIKSDELVRVTTTQIGKRLGVLSLLEKQIEKLPKCKLTLENMVETTEDFQVRRIKVNASKMRDLEIEVKAWRLIRESGLRSNFSEIVQDIINEEVNNKLI